MPKSSHSDGKIVSHAKQIHFKKLKDEGVVLNLETGDYFSLNKTGLFIWEACEKPKRSDELISKLSKRFGIAADRAKEDLEEFLGSLKKSGLVEFSKT